MSPKMAGTSVPESRATRPSSFWTGPSSLRVTKQQPILSGNWRKLLWETQRETPTQRQPRAAALPSHSGTRFPWGPVGRSIRPGERSRGVGRPPASWTPSPRSQRHCAGRCERGLRPRSTRARPAGAGRPSAHARQVRRCASLAPTESDTVTRALAAERRKGGEHRPSPRPSPRGSVGGKAETPGRGALGRQEQIHGRHPRPSPPASGFPRSQGHGSS